MALSARFASLWVATCVGLGTLPSVALGQRIEGRLLSEALGTPLPAGEVVLTDLQGRPLAATRSDSLGAFVLELPDSGTYLLHGGHRDVAPTTMGPFRIARTQLATVDLRLPAAAVALGDSLVVSVPHQFQRLLRSGFYRRAARGHGTALGPQDLAARHATRPLDLFWNIPGLRVVHGPRGERALRFWRSRCPPAVFIDGMRRPDLEDLRTLSVHEIAALEAYQGSQAPPEYGGLRAGCGVILVWTAPPRP